MVDPSCADLATKAELQELRDQLNAALGGKENGGTENIFAAGKSTALISTAVGGTLLGMATKNAPNVITDIALETAGEGAIWKELQTGIAKLTTFKGNGSKTSSKALEQLGKVAGQATKIGKTGGQVAKNSQAALLVLAQLATIAATLAINIATVKVIDKRIEAEASGTKFQLDAMNDQMLRLWQKHQGDLDKVNEEILQNNELIERNTRDIDENRNAINILKANDLIQTQNIEQLKSNVATLKAENLNLRSEIADLEFELEDIRVEFEEALNIVETQLEEANKTIESQEQQLQEQNERITVLEAKIVDYEAQIEDYKVQITDLQTNFAELRTELDRLYELNPDLVTEDNPNETEEERDYRWKTYYETTEETYERLLKEHNKPAAERKKWATITSYELQSEIIEKTFRQQKEAFKYGFGGSGSSTARAGVVATQTGVLELAQQLTDPKIDISTDLYNEDLFNESQTFKDRMALLLPGITNDASMKEQDWERLERLFNGGLGSNLMVRLDDIADRTSERRMADAVQTGICQSMNAPNQCSVPGVSNPKQGLKGGFDGLNALLNGADLLQNSALGKAVDRIDKTVHHATWGLEAVQKWGKKAWEATHADKILNALIAVMVVHNGVMLSTNIAQTIGDTASLALKAIGIKNSDDTDIDVNEKVGSLLQSMVIRMLGANNYAQLTRKIAAANRVYQAGANIISTVRSISDSAYNLAETTGDNVAAIGNALRAAGTVRENAYAQMPDASEAYNKSRLLNRLDKVDNVTDALYSISSDAVDITEEVANLQSDRKEYQDALKEAKEVFDKAETDAKTKNVQSADPKEEDEYKAPVN